MKIICVDGKPAERRTRRFLIPAKPYALVPPGKRSLTISATKQNRENRLTKEHTLEVDLLKGLEYCLTENEQGLPSLVVTKI